MGYYRQDLADCRDGFSYPVNALHLMIYPRYVQKKQFISYLGVSFGFKKTLLALLCSPVCKGSQDSSHLGQLPPAITTVTQSLVPVYQYKWNSKPIAISYKYLSQKPLTKQLCLCFRNSFLHLGNLACVVSPPPRPVLAREANI